MATQLQACLILGASDLGDAIGGRISLSVRRQARWKKLQETTEIDLGNVDDRTAEIKERIGSNQQMILTRESESGRWRGETREEVLRRELHVFG